MNQAEVTSDLLDKYERLTQRALEAAKDAAPEGSPLRRMADDYRRMATAYLADARHFREQGHWVRAYGALNYAHAWLDAGARIGLFGVGGDDQLFTLSE